MIEVVSITWRKISLHARLSGQCCIASGLPLLQHNLTCNVFLSSAVRCSERPSADLDLV